MLRSMTAYGRTATETPFGHLGVEILSVNRKYLDIQVQIPKYLISLELDIRKWITAVCSRGQISVRIFPHFEKSSPVKIVPNLPVARELYQAWQEIADDLGLGVESFTLNMLKDEPGIMIQDDSLSTLDSFKEWLQKAVEEALGPFLAMKDKEGKNLQDDLLMRVRTLQKIIDGIAKFAPNATEKFRDKLRETIEKTLPNSHENEDRVLREICVYAEKVDISEEITRFNSHLKQMEQNISGKNTSVGKTLEFILQELGREINTIGAKASDIEVTRLVVEAKSEIERIREQVQNVE